MYGDFEVYQRRAAHTRAHFKGDADNAEMLNNAALGLSGEAGEFCDLVKKHFYHGHPLNREKLEEELGDLLWYIAEGCDALGLNMADVARKNNEKLAARYPRGFDPDRSINRAD